MRTYCAAEILKLMAWIYFVLQDHLQLAAKPVHAQQVDEIKRVVQEARNV